MTKQINITNKYILEGEKANPQNCAIARAIKSQLRKVKDVSVVGSHISLNLDNKMFVAEMPEAGAAFIKRFDKGMAVNPFKLKLKFRKGFKLTS